MGSHPDAQPHMLSVPKVRLYAPVGWVPSPPVSAQAEIAQAADAIVVVEHGLVGRDSALALATWRRGIHTNHAICPVTVIVVGSARHVFLALLPIAGLALWAFPPTCMGVAIPGDESSDRGWRRDRQLRSSLPTTGGREPRNENVYEDST